jgi:peptidoglycan/LPS O-acetylase OafA/YrhL
LLIIATCMGQFAYVRFLVLAPIIIIIGLKVTGFLVSFIDKIGDISYGVYIYAFPVQQTLVYYFKLEALQLMIFSLIISCAFGFFSWHLIEKRFLEYKLFWRTAQKNSEVAIKG